MTKVKKSKPTDPIIPTAIYDINAVADLLDIHPRQVYRLINEKENPLPARKISNKFRVTGENLLNYLGSQTYTGGGN